MGQFDQTVRPLGKMDNAALFAWAISCSAPQARLTFQRWDDTRRLVCPGEPERTNDLVAVYRDDDRPHRPVWLVGEVEEEPEKGILYRLGHYELLLGKEVNPDADPSGALVASLLINLTGEQKVLGVDWTLAVGKHGTRLAPFVVNAAQEDALLTLARIERGDVGLPVLPLLSLMRGGGTPEFVRAWKAVADREPDPSKRKEYREAVVVFAELTRSQVNWLKGTEDWMARESTYIKSWELVGEQRAELRTKRADLMTAVQVRLQNPVPEAIRLAIEGTTDLGTLESWYRAALTAEKIADFRKEMNLGG